MRDPVDRIAEIKAADPRRRELVTIFDAWWAAHGNVVLKAKDLDPEVIKLIDGKSVVRADGSLQYSRQYLTRFLARNAGTRVGGYGLVKLPPDQSSRPVAHYNLIQQTEELTI